MDIYKNCRIIDVILLMTSEGGGFGGVPRHDLYFQGTNVLNVEFGWGRVTTSLS